MFQCICFLNLAISTLKLCDPLNNCTVGVGYVAPHWGIQKVKLCPYLWQGKGHLKIYRKDFFFPPLCQRNEAIEKWTAWVTLMETGKNLTFSKPQKWQPLAPADYCVLIKKYKHKNRTHPAIPCMQWLFQKWEKSSPGAYPLIPTIHTSVSSAS